MITRPSVDQFIGPLVRLFVLTHCTGGFWSKMSQNHQGIKTYVSNHSGSETTTVSPLVGPLFGLLVCRLVRWSVSLSVAHCFLVYFGRK